MPAIILNSSPARCDAEPVPNEPMLIVPGFALASAISSATVLAGTDGCAASTIGRSVSPDTGARSRCRSNGTLVIRVAMRADPRASAACNRRAASCLGGKGTAGPRPIFDDDRLTEPLGQPRSNDARCRYRHRHPAETRRSGAPAAMDTPALSLIPTRSAAQRHLPPYAEIDGEEAPPSRFTSFNHLVGAGEQRRRHVEAEHPCGLSVNDEFELAHLLDRQFRRLCTLEDATGIDADDTPRIREVGSVAHQPAGFGDFTRGGSDGNRVARRHGTQLNPPAVEKSAGVDEEGIGPLAHKRCKCGIDLAAVGSVEDLDLQPEGTSSRFDLFLRALARPNNGRIDQHCHTRRSGH